MTKVQATFTGRRTAWAYLPLGFLMLAAVTAGVLFAEDRAWFLLLCGVPGLLVVWAALTGGFAAVASKIALSENGLTVNAPTWRGMPMLPLQRVTAGWRDVITVQRRTELYGIMGSGSFPVPVWRLKTRTATVVFGGRIIPKLGEAMAEIAHRSGVQIIDEGFCDVSLQSALLHGTPAWRDEFPTGFTKVEKV